MAKRPLRPSVMSLTLIVGLSFLGSACTRMLVGTKPAAPEPPRVVDVTSRRSLAAGEVVGFTGRYGSHVWLGLPYAAPPVGERRWRAPVEASRWEGVREAVAFGGHCPQFASPFGGVKGDPDTVRGNEDCLYLNVYAPRLDAGAIPSGPERLPVMMWIHGGGNVVGLGDFYDGGRLATRERVIVVTVNYRLGPFGWFRHAALRDDATTDADRSGNFGTLDLVRALEWVRDNAAGFGGDPGRVTIFGESAGGRDVATLLVSPKASGLFHRAIVQSGGTNMAPVSAGEHWSDDPEPGHAQSSNEIIARLMVREGRARDRVDARRQMAAMRPAALAAWLRGKTPAEILGAYARENVEGLIAVPQLFADGAVLPAGDALDRFATGDWNRVPVILGTTKDENKVFQFTSPIYVRRWLGVIPRMREPSLYLATAEAMTSMWKATGADGPAAAIVRTEPRVFVYRFDWDEEPTILGTDLAAYLGAAHGFEIPFVFGHYDLGPQANVIFTDENLAGREELSTRLMSYWAAFAYGGDPDRGRRGELPRWTAWDTRAGAHKTMHLDTAAGGGLRMGSDPVTTESVLASVEADARLDTPRKRCWVLHELARWSRGFKRQDYEARPECRPYPFGKLPWR